MDATTTRFVIIPNKLELWSVDSSFQEPSNKNEIYFNTDQKLIYTAFFADFGPLDIGKTYEFCCMLDNYMKSATTNKQKVIYYCSNHLHCLLNSAVLILSYMTFVRDSSLAEAYGPFYGCEPLTTYRDAAFCLNTCPLTLLDCAMALRRVKDLSHYEHDHFDHATFLHLSKLHHGDVSWIVPNKFIAFSGPLSKRRQLENGNYTLTATEYVPLFKKLGVTCVVRFNNKCYNKSIFVDAGIRHVDLFYEDGGNPTPAIMQKFIQISEREKGAIAVHCKAGLGRTGTNIAAYMIKHYGYSAREATAWCRICRPGSVVGPQQQYLASVEPQLKAEGKNFWKQHGLGLMVQASIKRPSGSVLEELANLNIVVPFGKSEDDKNEQPSLMSKPTSKGPTNVNLNLGLKAMKV